MRNFRIPEGTTVPTITSAVEQATVRLRPFMTGLHGNDDHVLRHLRMLCGVVLELCQSPEQFRQLATARNLPQLGDYADEAGREWRRLASACFADVARRGIDAEVFMHPGINGQKPWHGCDVALSADMSLYRKLDCNFHLGDLPSTLLLRQLAVRILLKAYAGNVPDSVPSSFIGRLREMELPHNWAEAQELLFGIQLYYGHPDAIVHQFEYGVVREFFDLRDLFELTLRQLNDPLPLHS